MGRFRLGSTSLLDIHHVEKSTNQRWAFTLSSVLVFRTAQVENTGLKCSTLFERCLTRDRMRKWITDTHTQESLYDTYFKHGIGWHTTQYEKGYCQWYDDFQGNEGQFIGDWLDIVYFSNNTRKLSERTVCAWSVYSTAVPCFILFQTSFPQPFSTIRSLAIAYHVIDRWIV